MKIPGDGQFNYGDFDALFVTIGQIIIVVAVCMLTDEKCPVCTLGSAAFGLQNMKMASIKHVANG